MTNTPEPIRSGSWWHNNYTGRDEKIDLTFIASKNFREIFTPILLTPEWHEKFGGTAHPSISNAFVYPHAHNHGSPLTNVTIEWCKIKENWWGNQYHHYPNNERGPVNTPLPYEWKYVHQFQAFLTKP